jgi:hypothetical protein
MLPETALQVRSANRKSRVKAEHHGLGLAGARTMTGAVLNLTDFISITGRLKDVGGGQAQVFGAQTGAQRVIRAPPLERNAFKTRAIGMGDAPVGGSIQMSSRPAAAATESGQDD